MPFCPKCGSEVGIGDRFCSNCGVGLHAVTPPTAVTTPVNSVARSDYRIILVSRGTCSRAVAIDMISDLLGYTDPDAARIVDNAPIVIAQGLTAIQAQYISQAIAEYGMQLSIYNSDGYVDMGSKATSSVYNSDGSFLSTVAAVLTGLTLTNRVTSFNRWTQPAPVLFNPIYRRPAPPSAYRRRKPAPRPAPIPVVHHAPPPPPPPHSRPAPKPVPAPAPPASVAGSRPVGPVAPPRPAPGNYPGPGPMNTPGGMGRNGHGGPMGPGGGRRG